MQIKNNGSEVRVLSHRGVDHTLTPGSWVERPVTEEEAAAYRSIGLEVTGEPEIVAPAPRKGDKA